ncbi:hypothetical protein HC928_02515 [bacterium]|nr:hypothetical protein [bacterium]
MDRQQWLSWRKDGIGASDAIVIMGQVPREWEINTPYKLWADKVFGTTEATGNSAMFRGIAFEQEALAWLGDQVGVTFQSQKCFEHPEKNWMRATFDGITEDESVSCEVKICKREFYDQIKNGKIPDCYKPQVMHQMIVKPTKVHYLCAYIPEIKKGEYIAVKRDEGYISEMMEKHEEFWECVQTITPPPLTDWDYIQMEENEEWVSLTERLKGLREEVENARVVLKKEEEVKEELKRVANFQSCMGNGIKLTKVISKGFIDYGKIPELKEVNLEVYRKDPIKKFSIKVI